MTESQLLQGGMRQEDAEYQVGPSKVSKTLSQKQNTSKRALCVAQLRECLPSKDEDVVLIPSTIK
jgi:hypothetical protein